MSFQVDIAARRGDFRLEAAFASDARVLALFGPSGAGKTTLLNAIAGLIRPERGRVAVAGTTLHDAAAGVDLPARRRRLGYVFQDGRLFPHMSVRANLGYGARFTPPEERWIDAGHVVELLGLSGLLGRWPSGLSGGEKQRVALGRALMTSPRALLLDEPFASLDAARKADLYPYLERLRDDLAIPILLVSHQRDEVDRLAGAVVAIEDGRAVSPR